MKIYLLSNTTPHRVVEVNVAIVCACMTTLPAFIARSKVLSSDFFSSLRSRKGGSTRIPEYGSSGHSNHSGNDQTPLSPLSPISISKSYMVSCTPLESDKDYINIGNGKGIRGKDMF